MTRVLLAILSITFLHQSVRADDWPQWLGPKRDGVWRETGVVEKFPAGGPKVLWRTPIAGGYSGPAVANGRVFITDYVLKKGSNFPDNPFDGKSITSGVERVLCLDEKSGKIVWERSYPVNYQVSYAAGPRTTPIVSGGKVFTLGTMGDLMCLNEKSGEIVWSKTLMKEYQADRPLWGYAASPLLEGDLLISLVGGTGSAVVAFHKDTGKEVWRALTAPEIGYAPPIMIDAGGAKQLLAWHAGAVNGLEVQTGKVHWTVPWGDSPSKGKGQGEGLKAGMSIPTPRQSGDRLFLSCFYDGSLALKLASNGSKADVIWKQKGRSEEPDDTLALHCVMSTPFIKDDYVYGVCSYGQLRCIKLQTGERVWSDLKATGGKEVRWGNAFLVPQADRVVLFNEHGDLILARMSSKGYDEISRANILEPTNTMAGPRGRRVIWSHPAFANRNVYARNDREIICVSLAAN